MTGGRHGWMIGAIGMALLSACGTSEPAGNIADATAAGAREPVGATVDAPMNETSLNEATPASPAPPASPSAAAGPVLPLAWHGRWGMVAADCDPARADNKGLMTVTGDALRFYEARATVRRATPVGDDAIDLALGFTGEGQEWTTDTRLTLVDGGTAILRKDRAPPFNARYARCPA